MLCDVINTLLILLQATNDSVFSPTSPPAGEFTVDLVRESTNTSVGIDIFGGCDTVKGPPAVFIKTLSPDGVAASDGRLCAGKNQQSTFMLFSSPLLAIT